MKSALLLPNIAGFPSESMRRYADELSAAAAEAGAGRWSIRRATCQPSRGVARLLGENNASRISRFAAYPASIRKAGPADVYHVLDHSHANLALAVPAKRAVLTCHDIIPLLAARGLVPIPVPALTRWTFPLRLRCMRRCRMVIAISESTKRNLVEVGRMDPSRIRVVHYGVNPRFRPPADEAERMACRNAIRQRHGIPPDAGILLQVATATRYKNTPAVLKALARLGRDLRLVRVGAAMFEEETALAETLGVARRIHEAGRLCDDELLAQYYRGADVLVFPSLWEGFGWPPLEAMACGLPVVTSTAASLLEVVGNAGRCVEANDDEALAAAVRGLFADATEWRKLSRLGVARASAFTWARCGRETLAVYDEVAV